MIDQRSAAFEACRGIRERYLFPVWSAGANVDTKLTFLPPEVTGDVGSPGLSHRGRDWFGGGARRGPPRLGSPRQPPYSSLYLALVIFCINGLCFSLAALTPLVQRYAGIKRFYEQHGRRIVIADMQLTMASLAFLWLGVVGVI